MGFFLLSHKTDHVLLLSSQSCGKFRVRHIHSKCSKCSLHANTTASGNDLGLKRNEAFETNLLEVECWASGTSVQSVCSSVTSWEQGVSSLNPVSIQGWGYSGGQRGACNGLQALSLFCNGNNNSCQVLPKFSVRLECTHQCSGSLWPDNTTASPDPFFLTSRLTL